MRQFSLLLIPVLFFISCNSNPPCEGERKLSHGDWLTHYKMGKFYKDVGIWIDMNGNSISVDSMMQLDNKVYKGDPVVNCKGEVLRYEIRYRTENDDVLQTEWDTYNYNNLDNYLAFIDFLDVEPELEQRYIEAAETHFQKPEVVEVDCGKVSEILAACYHDDQAVRNGDNSKGSMREVDQINISQFSSIVKECGYDAVEKEGEETVRNAWFLVQHANRFERRNHFDFFMKCTKNGLIRYKTMALMIDRKLVDEKKPQIYGSQFGYDQKAGQQVMHPVQDIDRMIHLRDSIGLMPIEEYAERLNGIYRPKE